MNVKKAATFLFDATVLVVFITMSVLIFCGFYKAIGTEQTKAIQSAPIRTEPIRTVTEQPVPVQTIPEVVEVVEPEVIEIECVWVEPVETVPSYSEADLEMLALVIYQEAGSDLCSDETRLMVGNVALNRVADPRFPDTLEEVLTEVTPSGFGAYGRLHWTGLVWPERARYLSEAHAVERAYECAERLLNGERVFSDDVVWQAEFMQGTEVVAQQDGFYFCR